MRTASKVEPNEAKAVWLSFVFVLVLMTAYYILRPIRDAMASNWTDAELSTLYTATFISSAIAVTIYGAACSKIKIGHLVPGVYGFFALSFLAFYGIMQSSDDVEWVGKTFYVWISVFSLFHISVFWSFMADIFNKEQAPRLFGFIAAGSSIGAIAGPAISFGLAQRLGPDNLLLLSAVLLIPPIIVVLMLERIKHTELHNDIPPAEIDYQEILGTNPFSGFVLFVRDPYLLGIGLFILLYTGISTFVYFELKNLMIDVDENIRVQIWAGMDLAVNVLAITTAMFGTGRLATRFGLAKTLTLVPVAIVAGLLIVAAAPLLFVVVGLQIVRRAGNYAITRPGREMLYTVVDRESRFKAKSVIDIVVYRGGDMATAWVFTGLTQGLGLSLGAIAAVGAAIAAVWATVARLLGKAYTSRHAHPEAGDLS
ncbi:MAG: MFS transporter [Gammaproteobacteria bacterium]